MDTQPTPSLSSRADMRGSESAMTASLPFLALLFVGIAFPLFGGGYWGVLRGGGGGGRRRLGGERFCAFWAQYRSS